MSEPYVPPTQDEIRRVADHWERVKAMSCQHPEIEFHGQHEPPKCSACGRPIRMLSDYQIEELRR